MSSQPIFTMSPRVKKTHDFLINNLLIFYMPVGICKCVIFNILKEYKYCCRSFCFYDPQLALVDIVPRSEIVIPILKRRPNTQYDHFGNEAYFGCSLASANPQMVDNLDVIQDYAYVLEEGHSPKKYLNMTQFHWGKFYRPCRTSHFCNASVCRTL